MRIQYNYNKYNNSKTATDTSDFLNMLLAYLAWIPGIGSLAATLVYGIIICEKLESNDRFPWEMQVLFIIVYIVDILFILLHTSVDILTDNIALKEQLINVEEENKQKILKMKRKETFCGFLTFLKRAIIYFLPINLGVVFISLLIYGISKGVMSLTCVAGIVILLDVLACYLINKYTKWGHIFDGKNKSLKNKIPKSQTNIQSNLGIEIEQCTNVNQANDDRCEENTINTATPNEKQSIEVLREYKKLLDDGIISREEFEIKKKQLLGL